MAVGPSPVKWAHVMSESEAYEAEMSLPSDARRRLVLRLLESVDPNESFDAAAESWLRIEAPAAYDALKADPAGHTAVQALTDLACCDTA